MEELVGAENPAAYPPDKCTMLAATVAIAYDYSNKEGNHELGTNGVGRTRHIIIPVSKSIFGAMKALYHLYCFCPLHDLAT